MRIVFDECVPRTLRRHLPQHDVATVHQINATGLENGALLDLLDQCCDVFITTDQNMQHQQRLINRSFTVVVLYARSNALPALLPLLPEIGRTLDTARPGILYHVGSTPPAISNRQDTLPDRPNPAAQR
jgi:hypothetical protein